VHSAAPVNNHTRKDELMSHDSPTGATPVNQNERRADRAIHAIEAGSDCEFRENDVAGLESDVRDLLANLRHLCDRWGLDYGACDRRAYTIYAGDREESPLAGPGLPRILAREAEPVWVVTVDHREQVGLFSVSAGELCHELFAAPELAAEMWALLLDALADGRAAEDPEESPRRTLIVEEKNKAVLAGQLIDLLAELTGESELAGVTFAQPARPLASYLIGPAHRST
jgi:hypothetical protein